MSTNAEPKTNASTPSSELLIPNPDMDEDIDNNSINIKVDNVKIEEDSKKRKLEVKAEPHCIIAQQNEEPQRKRIRLSTDNAENEKTKAMIPPPPLQATMPMHPQFMMPMPPHHTIQMQQMQHPQYFVPMMPYGGPHHHYQQMNMNNPYMPHPHFNGYRYAQQQNVKNENKNDLNIKPQMRRRRRAKYMDTSDDELNEDLLNDNDCMKSSICSNTDRSPFKTTYISRSEEIELKSTNSALYSQFNGARQSIYQQYKQKIDAIRHSNMMSSEKIKLNMKIAAIDAKVQEKKLFLSYLEMCKPQPNSWLVSSSAMTMNSFARNIANQQQTPASYANNNNQEMVNNAKQNNQESNEHNDAATKKKNVTSAKRVKKPKFSEYNVRVLRDWYETHTNNPYPSASEKHLMCQLTGLTKYQVSRWFCNVRTRKPPPELSDNDEDVVNNKVDDGTGPIPAAYHYPMPMFTHHAPAPPHLQHLVPMTPLNMPPMPTITPNMNGPFNFSPMNNMNQRQSQNQTPMNGNNNNNNNVNDASSVNQTGNMISENAADNGTEGLMPPINSNFIKSTPTAPPPLIEEDSNQSKSN